MLFCQYCEIVKNIHFEEHLLTVASDDLCWTLSRTARIVEYFIISKHFLVLLKSRSYLCINFSKNIMLNFSKIRRNRRINQYLRVSNLFHFWILFYLLNSQRKFEYWISDKNPDNKSFSNIWKFVTLNHFTNFYDSIILPQVTYFFQNCLYLSSFLVNLFVWKS